jgi:hypothetical protein
MQDLPRRTNRSVWSDPISHFFFLVSLTPIGFGLVDWLGFTGSAEGTSVAVVLSFLVVIFVAVPWLLHKLVTDGEERQDDRGLLDWLQGHLDIATGRLEAKEFAVQVLIAPVAAVIGLGAMAVVLTLAG